MGHPPIVAVVCFLLCPAIVLAGALVSSARRESVWREAYEQKTNDLLEATEMVQLADKEIALRDADIATREAEILRLRKNALTSPAEKVDNSVVKAKSTADVRRLTEAAFGLELREALNHQGEEAHDS